MLHKWQPHINEKCEECDEVETVKHMIYECKKVKNVWKIVSDYLKLQISWKIIVCGFFNLDINYNVTFINLLLSIVSYAIFKFNNREKWNNEKNACTIEQFVLRNLRFFYIVCKEKKITTLRDTRYDRIIEALL